MRAALIYNPGSGRRSKECLLPEVLTSLERAGFGVDCFPTERPGHASDLARRATAGHYARVIVWGGDGTLNEAAQGLLGTGMTLGILPGGTVNVFAREAGIPRGLAGAIEVLVQGRVAAIPVGIANGRPFLLMAGVGLDAEVVRRLKGELKSALGALAFWLDGFRLLARYPMTPIRVRCDGRELTGTGLIAGKLRRYGPRYFIASDARVEEPALHVVVFQGRRRRDYLRYLFGVLARKHLSFEDVVHFKANRLNVESEEKVPYQLDGEPAGHTPVEIEVRDRALSVLLPGQKGIVT